jgi:hypothetical protein
MPQDNSIWGKVFAFCCCPSLNLINVFKSCINPSVEKSLFFLEVTNKPHLSETLNQQMKNKEKTG